MAEEAVEWCVGTPVDWKTTREVLTIALGVVGFFAWRRTILGKSRHEIAQAVIREALKVQQAIAAVRIGGAIFPKPETEAETESARRELQILKGLWPVYQERLGRMRDAVAELRLAALNAETLWRRRALPTVAGLEQCVRDLDVDVFEWFRLQHAAVDPAAPKSDEQHKEQVDSVVFDFSTARALVEDLTRSRAVLRPLST